MAVWFRTPFRHDTLNLVCLPQAGSDTGVFAKWRSDLGPDCEVITTALPGRGTRLGEPIPDRLEQLAEELLVALQKSVIVPYALLGASMGGWLGYELCRRIEQTSLPPPAGLIVIGSPAPGTLRKLPVLAGLDRAAATAALLAFNPALAPALAYPELFDMILPTIRADFENCARYAPPMARVATQILGFAGLDDPVVGMAAMQDWSKRTSGRFRLVSLPGDHGLIDAPPVGLTSTIRDFAAQALKSAHRDS